MFIITKKEVTVIFIAYYYELNQKLVIKSRPLPIIGDTMYQMEQFQYEATLYLNMGYYTIDISPHNQDMIKIVTDFGKFGYNIPLM